MNNDLEFEDRQLLKGIERCVESMRPHEKQLSYYISKTAHKSILNISLDVHMIFTGSMDYYHDYLKDVSLLQWAINNWSVSTNPLMRSFDDTVKSLIEIALEDHKKYVENYHTDLDVSVLDDPEYFMKG